MENKKTKLTISGSPKKSFKNFESSKSQGKKTVVIEKQTNRSTKKGNFTKSFGLKSSADYKRGTSNKLNNLSKTSQLAPMCLLGAVSLQQLLQDFMRRLQV